VLEPQALRKEIQARLRQTLSQYQN
jgi:hypothetical protein